MHGIFSYFNTEKPTRQDIEDADHILDLTPTGDWDPNTRIYAKNEENMIDSDGNMIDEEHRTRILLSDIPDSVTLNNDCQISDLEATFIDQVFDNVPVEIRPERNAEVYAMDALMCERDYEAQFMASIGAIQQCIKNTLLMTQLLKQL